MKDYPPYLDYPKERKPPMAQKPGGGGRMFIRYQAMGTVEIHGVRRIEEDHLYWYVWYGKPSDGPAFLRPQIFRKDAGTLTVMED